MQPPPEFTSLFASHEQNTALQKVRERGQKMPLVEVVAFTLRDVCNS